MPLAAAQLAAALLRAGKLVAFPTETVYGVGADATSPAATRRIFDLKGRPASNPLIVHVADTATAKLHTADWPIAAQRLAAEFWPGPLTLVLPRHPSICREATAGRETVAIRVPDHPLALAMLQAFGGPVAAPSANRSTRVSPTTAEHVRSEFGSQIDLILDGGACPIGIESTVLDLTTFPRPTLLRPGGTSVAEIEAVVGPVRLLPRLANYDNVDSAPSPGLSSLHYAPQTPAYRFSRDHYPEVVKRLGGTGDAETDEIEVPDQQDCITPHPHGVRQAQGPDITSPATVLLLSKAAIPSPHDVVTMPVTPDAYARVLYASLRGADAGGYSAIYIELPPDSPEWLAVRDRLVRATRPLAESTATPPR
jgi:L-threonylcarbamoyladenylate synthase